MRRVRDVADRLIAGADKDEAARRLGVTVRTVERYATEARKYGMLPLVRPGPKPELYLKVAAALECGASEESVCAALDISEASLRVAVGRATKAGLISTHQRLYEKVADLLNAGVSEDAACEKLALNKPAFRSAKGNASRRGLIPPAPTKAGLISTHQRLYEKVADLLNAGVSEDAVCEKLALSKPAFRSAKGNASRRGLIPPASAKASDRPKPPPDPLNAYHALRAKGAAPPLGSMGALLHDLPRRQLMRILDNARPEDQTLAAVVLRLAMERLNGQSDPRR
jgi:hypothetical protein